MAPLHNATVSPAPSEGKLAELGHMFGKHAALEHELKIQEDLHEDTKLVALLSKKLERHPEVPKTPAHVFGSIAQLRVIRNQQNVPAALEWFRNAVAARERSGADSAWREIVDRDLGQHELPGTEELQAAGLQTNEWLATNTDGDVVVYENWGTIDSERLEATLPLEEYARWNLYRMEARAILLDLLSRRSGHLVQFTQIFDCHGVRGKASWKGMPYLRELVAGDERASLRVRVALST